MTPDSLLALLETSPAFPHRIALLSHALHQAGPGLVCEFGVWRGDSINFIARQYGGTVYGFDAFRGLPEDGWLLPRQTFDRHGEPPPNLAPNVRLRIGWFDQTIPVFLEEVPGELAFVHIDSDVYSSSKTIFDLASARMREGCVVVFDELVRYPNWEAHEFKAFDEFLQETQVTFEVLGQVPKENQVAVRLHWPF